MSKLSELFHKSKTLDPDSIEELYIKELEAEKAELINWIKSNVGHLRYYSLIDSNIYKIIKQGE